MLTIQAQAIDINGYYENDVIGILKRDGRSASGDLSRLRLRIDSKFHPNFALHLEPRYYYLIKSEELPLIGVSDLDRVVWDRAYLKYYSDSFTLTAGKQRIAWGTGYIWNPTDIFNPFVLSFAVKEEEESNADAVRLEIPLGAAGGIDGYVLTNNQWDKAKKGIKTKTNIGLFDLSASYVDRGSGNSQIGFDLAGEVREVGVRCETAFVSSAEGKSFVQSVLGWDYTLENGLGMTMEYYYNGLGKRDKQDYDWIGLYTGKISELGMDYLYFGLNKNIDEITGVRGSLLLNLDDQSFLIYPSYTRNLAQNIDLVLEAMLLGGQEGSEFYPSALFDPTGFAGSKMILIRVIYNF